MLACPFGIPKVHLDIELMMKCDMCYDRTSVGLKPMCATVCPSQALSYMPPETVKETRRGHPVNDFRFGNEQVSTMVSMIAPTGTSVIAVDVADYIWENKDAD